MLPTFSQPSMAHRRRLLRRLGCLLLLCSGATPGLPPAHAQNGPPNQVESTVESQVENQASEAARVVTTVKPLQLIAGEIMDGVARPVSLIPPGQSPHDYTLRPSSRQAMADADLIIWVGPGLETFFVDLFEQFESGQSGSMELLEAMELPGLTLHSIGDLDSAGDPHSIGEEGHEHGAGQADARDDDEHGGGPDEDHAHLSGLDAHIWLDTGNALLIARAMDERLRRLDPDNATRYSENLERFSAELAKLEDRSRQRLEGLADRVYAVYHNGFQYFEKQHGLSHDLVFVNDLEIQPGIRHMVETRRQVQSLQPGCLLVDPSASQATIDTILGGASIERARADLMGIGIEAVAGGYVELIDELGEAVAACLRAAPEQ